MTSRAEKIKTDTYLRYILSIVKVGKEDAEKRGLHNARPYVLREHTSPEINEEAISILMESGEFKDVHVEEHIEEYVFNVSW